VHPSFRFVAHVQLQNDHSEVHLRQRLSDGERVIVKLVSQDIFAERELQCLVQLSHVPGVVQIRDTFIQPRFKQRVFVLLDAGEQFVPISGAELLVAVPWFRKV